MSDRTKRIATAPRPPLPARAARTDRAGRDRGDRDGLRPRSILETALYVDDLDRAAEFYESLLRLMPVHQDDRMKVLRVSGRNFLLLFRSGTADLPIEVPGGTIPPHDGSGALHVAFAIGPGEVPAWSRRLAAHGTPVEGSVTWPSGAQSLYFRDPDGHLVELATANLWEN